MKFIEKIQTLPEPMRRFLAGLALVLAALVLFNGWRLAVSSRLTMLSDTAPIFAQEEGLETVLESESPLEALSPIGGAYESLKGIASFIAPRGTPDQNKAASRFPTGETIAFAASSFGHTAYKAGNTLKDALYFLYEKSQREVYPDEK